MASDSEDDPYVKAGRAVTSGKAAAAPAASDDPYVAAGRKLTDAITSPAALAADVPTSPPEAPDWTWSGMARQAAAVPLRVAGTVGNALSDPSGFTFGNLVGRPLLTGFQTAHDLLAPVLGYDKFTPRQLNLLYGDFEDEGPGTRAVKAVSEATRTPQGTDPYNIKGATPFEQRVGNVAEGALTAGVLGGNIPAAIMGGTGVLGGDIAAENVDPSFAPGARLAGQIAGAKLGQTGANVGTRVVNAARGQTTPVAAAFDELGMDKRLLGDLSGSPTAQLAQTYGAKSPFGASIVGPAERKAVDQFHEAVQTTAGRLGTSTNMQAAGEVLQNEARNWRDVVFPQRQTQAWAPVDQLLSGETVVPGNYRASLTTLTNKLAALPDTAKALVPPKTLELLEAINRDVPPGGTMTWQQAQSLRSALGQVMGVPEIVQSVGKDQLNRAYGGISQDMRDTATAVDTRNTAAAHASGTAVPASALDAFTNANKVSTEGHAFIDNTLSKIISTKNKAQETIHAEDAAKSVLGSGDTTLQALRAEMPAAVDELAAFKLRNLAVATPGQAGATGTETSIRTFLTDLNRLRQQSPGGFQALFADPAVARKVEAMAIAANAMRETANRANTSGTGPYMALAEAVPTAVGTYAATGSPWAAGVSLAAPFAVNRAVGHAVTNPVLARIASAPGPRVLPNPQVVAAQLNMLRQTQPNPDPNALLQR